ncbi:cellulose biosynthesis protein BcsS [Camelimonas abortus]|uniref:Cellulose biosynthesis protein BcsS n=1 Tax=Camelimonas abortus TaxID=1017184 RepID=A0ABV7LDG9_9HYPH
MHPGSIAFRRRQSRADRRRDAGWRGRARGVCAGACLALTPGLAAAADWTAGYDTPSAGQGYGGAPNAIIAIDTSVTATTTNSLFANTSITGALTGDLDQNSGWRARVEGIIGGFEYNTTDQGRIIGSQQGASALVGYEWIEPDVHVAAYIGFNWQNIKLDPVDPGNSTRGHGYGLRVVGELYANPTEYTMTSAYGTYSTHANAFYTRFKLGYALWDRTFIGPEFQLLGDNSYRQWRLGAHITGLTFGRFQFGLSGGYLRDSRSGPGGYVLVDSRVTF